MDLTIIALYIIMLTLAIVFSNAKNNRPGPNGDDYFLNY